MSKLGEEFIKSEPDTRVAWIYPLKKEEITTETHKFGLQTEGAVPELGRIFASFICRGLHSREDI